MNFDHFTIRFSAYSRHEISLLGIYGATSEWRRDWFIGFKALL